MAGNEHRDRRTKKPRVSTASSGHALSEISSSSSDSAASLPGFVYDPVRKRYFRSQNGAPDNNFTVPVKQLLLPSSGKRYTWIHPCVSPRVSSRQVELLTDCGISRLDGASSFRIRLRTAGYRHDYLRDLLCKRPPEVCKWPVCSQQSFHAVDAYLHGDSPKVFYVSQSDRSSSSDVDIECRVAVFGWVRDKLVTKVLRRLKSGSIFPAELRSVHSVCLFPPGLAFMSCTSRQGDQDMGLCINETPTGLHFVPCHIPYHIATASSAAPLVATASRNFSRIRLFSFEDMDLDSYSLSEWAGSNTEDFNLTSLAFVEGDSTFLLAGNTIGQVHRVDYRCRSSAELLNSDSWKTTGLNGRCRVSALKSLQHRKAFITLVAGLPAEASKMHLWDCRNLQSPLSVFEDAAFPFYRDSAPINLSSDDSLVVHSDNEGTARCWDVDSGCMLVKVPVEDYNVVSRSSDWLPPVAFYADDGSSGHKALLIATRGFNPRITIHSL